MADDSFLDSQIQPLALPDGAGVAYANGDVRHLSPEDSLDYASISTGTRNLAYRDNQIVDKLNETVGVVNNREFVSTIPIYWTYVSPQATYAVTSLRIPAGFEARVVNAAISGTPPNQVLLQILQSPNTYGSPTGTSVVSTYGEFIAGTSFFPAGELIIQLTNGGTTGAQAVGSVMISLRPVSAASSTIIGPGVEGPQGPPGATGQTGPAGVGVPGAPGVPGLNWRGAYNNTAVYATNDAMSYNFGPGVGVASFVNINPCTGVPPPLPAAAPSANWTLLAYASPANPESLLATLTYFGTILPHHPFGYFQAPYTGAVASAQISVQTPPVGGTLTVDLVNQFGVPLGYPITVGPGVSVGGTTYAVPLNLAAGAYIQAEAVSAPGSTAGSGITLNLWFES